jgi:type IV secretion system protein VirD4
MSTNVTVAQRGVFDQPSDYIAFTVLSLAIALALGVYATGEVAGLISHFNLPGVGLGQIGQIISALPHHLADPKQAWPAAVRAELPGPIGFAIAGALVLLVVVTLASLVIRYVFRGRSRRGFASRKHLDAALTEKAVLNRGPIVRPSVAETKFALEDVGVRVGTATPGGTPVALSIENSIAVLAAPRQGKSSQVIIPWLHKWPGPALVTSVRRDVLESTATLRQALGPVYVLAPTGMVRWPNMLRWSPTSGCENFDKARQRAGVMVTVGRSNKAEVNGDADNTKFFAQAATNLLAGWLHAAAISCRSMADVLRWALDERLDEGCIFSPNTRKPLTASPGCSTTSIALLRRRLARTCGRQCRLPSPRCFRLSPAPHSRPPPAKASTSWTSCAVAARST